MSGDRTFGGVSEFASVFSAQHPTQIATPEPADQDSPTVDVSGENGVDAGGSRRSRGRHARRRMSPTALLTVGFCGGSLFGVLMSGFFGGSFS